MMRKTIFLCLLGLSVAFTDHVPGTLPGLEDLLERAKTKNSARPKLVKSVSLDEMAGWKVLHTDLDLDREGGAAVVMKFKNGRTKTIELGELQEFKQLKTRNCGYQTKPGSKFDAVLTGCRGEKRSLTIGGLGVWTFNRFGRSKEYTDSKHHWEDQAWRPPVLDDDFMKEQVELVKMKAELSQKRRMEAPVKRDAFEMKIRYYYENSFLEQACNGDHDVAAATILEIHAHTAVYLRHPSIGRQIFLKYDGKPTYVDLTLDAPTLDPFSFWVAQNNECDPTVGNHHLITFKDVKDSYKGAARTGSTCNPDCAWNHAMSEHGWGGGAAGTAGTVAHELGHTIGMHHTTAYEEDRPHCKGFMTYNEHPNVWSECNREMYEWTYEGIVNDFGQDKIDRCFVPTDPEAAMTWSPTVEIPCSPENWVGHKETCGECAALVDVYENGRTCQEYCERQGLYCVDAWDDENNNQCSLGATRLGCNFDFAMLRTSDGVCQCSQSADASVDDLATWALDTDEPTPEPTAKPTFEPSVAAAPSNLMRTPEKPASAKDCHTKIILESPMHTCDARLLRKQTNSNVEDCAERCGNDPLCTHFGVNHKNVCKLYDSCDVTSISKNVWDNYQMTECLDDMVVLNQGSAVVTSYAETPVAHTTYAETTYGEPVASPTSNQEAEEIIVPASGVKTMTATSYTTSYDTEATAAPPAATESTPAATPGDEDCYERLVFESPMLVCTGRELRKKDNSNIEDCAERCGNDPLCTHFALNQKAVCKTFASCDETSNSKNAWDVYEMKDCNELHVIENEQGYFTAETSEEEHVIEDEQGYFTAETTEEHVIEDEGGYFTAETTEEHVIEDEGGYFTAETSEEEHVIEDEGGYFTAETTEEHVIENEGGYFKANDAPISYIEVEAPETSTTKAPVTTEEPLTETSVTTEEPVTTREPEKPVSGCPSEQQLMTLPAASARTICEDAGCVYSVDMSDPFTTKRMCSEEAPVAPVASVITKMMRTAMEMPAPPPSPVTEEPVTQTTATTATPTTVTTAAAPAPVPEGPCYTKVPLASVNHTCSEKHIVKIENSSEEECAQACDENPECMFFTVNKGSNVCKTYWTCNETKQTKHVWDVFQMGKCAN